MNNGAMPRCNALATTTSKVEQLFNSYLKVR